MYLFYTSYLDEEVNCTEPSPSVSVPCIDIIQTVEIHHHHPAARKAVHAKQTAVKKSKLTTHLSFKYNKWVLSTTSLPPTQGKASE
jgi:hypothetical protein